MLRVIIVVPRIAPEDPGPPADDQAYAYLLGLYLGDGCISAHPRSGRYLRNAWPGLIQECADAIVKVRPGVRVYHDNISVARRASVALMDAHVGPKH
ncbi:hypothetical protein [Streptomyces flaveolus]|uniref:hypothetical protein n=1 Tax=Streptomyces flaveolus TaxID=67297 RepID=UPI003318F5CE